PPRPTLFPYTTLFRSAIGVAGAVHAHVSRRVPTVAILRCLGCPGDLAFAIYFAQALALGALGAVLGASLGVALHLGVLTFFRERSEEHTSELQSQSNL